MTYFAIHTMPLYAVWAMLDDSRCDNGCSLMTNCLARMGTCSEWQGTSLLNPENIPQIKQCINGVPRSTSTARYSTVPNLTLPRMSPMRKKCIILPRSCIIIFVALGKFGIDWILFLVDRFVRRKVSLKILRPASVLRRQKCGRSWLRVDPNLNLYLVRQFWKVYNHCGFIL